MDPHSERRSCLRRLAAGAAAAGMWLGLVGAAGCGGSGAPATPTAPAPSSGPVFLLRVEPGGLNRSGTNLSVPPWVSYFSCGEYANVSHETFLVTTEMFLFGPDGTRYTAEPGTGLVPKRFGPGDFSVGCGLATAFDYDSTHRLAVTYRLRVNYRHEDGTGSGSAEAEGVIRTSTPDVTGVVINKFRSRGPRGDQDQFVELLNVSSSPIVMHDWFLQVSIRSFEVEVGTETHIADATINPGCAFLLTATTPPFSSTFGTYSGSEPGDASLRPYLRDSGGLALRAQNGQVVDQVALGSNTVYREGTPLASFGSDNTDRSYARVGTDTGDNARDFRMVSPSTPRNSSRCR